MTHRPANTSTSREFETRCESKGPPAASSNCYESARGATAGSPSSLVSCLQLAVGTILIATTTALAAPPNNTNHQDLSYYLTSDGTRIPIRTAEDWQHRRADILAGMEQAMGPFPHPAKPVPLGVQTLEQSVQNGYIRRKIAYHTDDPKQTTHAWVLLPLPLGEGRGEGALRNGDPRKKYPAVLCLHQTTPNGKDSPVGLTDRPTLHYAKELAQRGYVTLSPDYPSFGESKDYNFDADQYASGSMKAIYDNSRAIDLLQSLPEVDPNCIGCIGHSLGGHNSLFTAVFDQRIKAVVTSCGFTAFHKYMNGNLHGWTTPRYMPLITAKYHNNPDEMPFDFPEVLAAVAPRAVFINAPTHDDNFDIAGVKQCIDAAKPIYNLLGAPDRLKAVHPNSAHDFPDPERKQAYDFLDQLLKHAAP